MPWNPNVPNVINRVQDDLAAMRENFQHLDPLAQAVDELQTVSGLAPVANELQTVSGLAPYVQAILDSRIVEMGSNSNGEYVRWENGLQVCFLQASISGNGSGVVNSGTVTLPAAFADTNYRSLTTPRSSDPHTTSSLMIIDASSMTVYWQTPISASGRTISVVAIGRWK